VATYTVLGYALDTNQLTYTLSPQELLNWTGYQSRTSSSLHFDADGISRPSHDIAFDYDSTYAGDVGGSQTFNLHLHGIFGSAGNVLSAISNIDVARLVFAAPTWPVTPAVTFNEIFSGDDLVVGNRLGDTLSGGAGNDTLYGLAGNDTLIGGAGADLLDGGAGFDFASYATSGSGVSVDLIYAGMNSGDARGDTFTGIEALVGSDNNDSLAGSDGNDVIYGGAGNDYLYGRGGNDALLGTGGDDVMNGGLGNDTLYGDQGSGVDHDTFVFDGNNFGNDVIQGFSGATGINHDVISFSTTAFANFADVMAHAGQFGTDVIISNGAVSVQLVAVNIATLSADDFTFA
jgi:Ca2+-binding RTX toxin-like protein